MLDFILNFDVDSEEDALILLFLKEFETKNKLKFTTSGTTGKEKKIYHNIETIKKNIRIDKKFENSIWGLTYPANKIAASQVILQAYLNGSKIVNLYNKTIKEISNLIFDYQISHISATPTFYRMLLDDVNVYENVKQITLGGEAVDGSIIEKIKKSFPNAKVKNIYALTEFGTLFASEYDYFNYNDSIKKIITIKDSEIFVIDKNNLHPTGDIIEWVSENTFKIIGRESNMINVGGYKVNPIKVEVAINSLSYVTNSLVYSKSNSVTGNVVVADVSLKSEITRKKIKEDLSNSLQKFEIPLLINFVDDFSLTETGKLSRK